MDEQSEQPKFAVLIDGENAQPSLLPQVLAEVSKVGFMTVKRIYGDWTSISMNSWKNSLHEYAIQPIQQFRYTVGKNSTDSAMIIDAMDLLHSHNVSGFCIVASDSDYTRLATRIREDGLFVIGVGERKTPAAFVNACNQFIYTENLAGPRATTKKTARETKPGASDPVNLLIEGFNLAAKEEEWIHLATLGNVLRQLAPAFDPRTYGHQRLQSLIRQYPETFTLKRDTSKKPPVVYVALAAPKSDGD
jgi:NYN domain/OST-HTH/LOTUS domain